MVFPPIFSLALYILYVFIYMDCFTCALVITHHVYPQVAIHRSQGKLIEATTGLHKILRVFPGDMSTWIELAELHGSCGEYMVRGDTSIYHF